MTVPPSPSMPSPTSMPTLPPRMRPQLPTPPSSVPPPPAWSEPPPPPRRERRFSVGTLPAVLIGIAVVCALAGGVYAVSEHLRTRGEPVTTLAPEELAISGPQLLWNDTSVGKWTRSVQHQDGVEVILFTATGATGDQYQVAEAAVPGAGSELASYVDGLESSFPGNSGLSREPATVDGVEALRFDTSFTTATSSGTMRGVVVYHRGRLISATVADIGGDDEAGARAFLDQFHLVGR